MALGTGPNLTLLWHSRSKLTFRRPSLTAQSDSVQTFPRLILRLANAVIMPRKLTKWCLPEAGRVGRYRELFAQKWSNWGGGWGVRSSPRVPSRLSVGQAAVQLFEETLALGRAHWT